MNEKLLALLRNIVEELGDLRYEADRGDRLENEVTIGRQIDRGILIQALIKDGEEHGHETH